MIRFSDIMGTLTSAYLITGDEEYARQAVVHLNAWFVGEATRVNPNLLYGQAIKGRHAGRSIGIIDTIHLVEVARSAKILSASAEFPQEDQQQVKAWFGEYLEWLNHHPYGQKEREHPNNHGVCWSLQAGAFALLGGMARATTWSGVGGNGVGSFGLSENVAKPGCRSGNIRSPS